MRRTVSRNQHPRPAVAGASESTDFPASTTLSFIAAPADAMPAYLTPVLTESQWGNKVVRVSNTAGLRHRYSSKAAWNSDMSLLLLDYPPRVMLNGTTYAQIATGLDTMGYFTWSNTDPTLAFAYSGLQIRRLAINPTTGAISVTRSKTLSTYSAISLGGGQGSGANNSDRYIAFIWYKAADTSHGVGVFDTSTDTVVTEKVIATGTGITDVESVVDNCGMSWSGDYVIIGMHTGDGTGATNGTWIMNRDGTNLRQVCTNRPHWDWSMLADGTTDVIVLCSQSSSGGGPGSRLGMYRASDLLYTPILTNWPQAHVSGRNIRRPGWVYCSSVAYAAENFAGYQTVFAASLDSPGTVQMFAHVHGPSDGSVYEQQPHFSVSPDGKRGIFASVWGGSSIYSFVVGKNV